MDLSRVVLEEIALDGLDGITLESLWYRLTKTIPKFPLSLDEKAKAFLWSKIITKLKDVEFYAISEDRESFVEPTPEYYESGVEIYKPSRVTSILPCCYITNGKERGSCSTYSSRVSVTTQVRGADRQLIMSYEEVILLWGRRLVVVASQTVRDRVLLYDATDAHMVKLTTEMYCIMEYIAKGRHYGVYGSDAFSFLQDLTSAKVTHGMMGYLRKKLKEYGIITQASHLLMKNSKNMQRLCHENICYLKRMQTPRNTGYSSYHQKIEQFLLSIPDRKYFLADMCSTLELNRRKIHKFLKLKTQHFDLSYVNVDDSSAVISSPNSSGVKQETNNESIVAGEAEDAMDTQTTDTPDAAEPKFSELMSLGEDNTTSTASPKSKPITKKAKVTSRKHLVVKLKQSIQEAGYAESAAESEEEDNEPVPSVIGPELRMKHVPMFVQVKNWIDSCGPEGATRNMLRDAFGLHSLQARNIMKCFHKSESCHFFYTDCKRQRIERMCSLEYASHHLPDGRQGTKAKQANLTTTATPVDKEIKKETSAKPSRHLTNKTLERHKTIIDIALDHKLILFPDLHKLIITAESDKYDTRMDRKTLKRMCEYLNKINDIRIFKTTVQVETKSRDLFYVCEPNMTLDNKLMRSSIESQRSELTSSVNSSKLNAREPKQEPTSDSENAEGKKKGKEKTEPQLKFAYNSNISAKKYGYSAKMKRVETLHKFLYYCVYHYEGCADKEMEREEDGTFVSADGDITELQVYCDTKNWKRFLPPNMLSTHNDREGTACILDLGTQLPLVLFLALVRLPYEVPAVIHYLDDPIKRLIPVRHLPTSMQAPLLYRKKYVSALRDTVAMLCMMGLATNISTTEGGVTFREISVIYLHKTSVIVDTLHSYITDETTMEEQAKRTHVYSLNQDMHQVEQYWISLCNVCTSTPVKRVEKNKAKSLEETETIRADMFKDEALKESASPKTMDQVHEGIIPGDGRGAGGLDTLFHANLRRQWHTMFEKMVPSAVEGQSSAGGKLSSRQQFLKNSQATITPIIVHIDSSNISPKTKDLLAMRKRANSDQMYAVKKMRLDTDVSKPTEDPEKKKLALQRKRQKYEARRAKDEKDYIAETHLETQRSSFTPQEDEALMLAKIGLNILNCKEVASKPVRDFIHKCLPNQARDKSSSSCWARMNRILQFNKRERAMHLYTSIAMNDPEIARYEDQEPLVSSVTFADTYMALMDLIMKRCESAADTEVAIDLSTIGRMEELTTRYNLIVIAEAKDSQPENMGHAHNHKISPPVEVSWSTPVNDVDIARFTLTNFTMSYLLANDKINRTFQMHKVFEQYPATITDSALFRLQSNKVATIRKTSTARTVRRFGLTFRYKLFTERLQVVSRDIFQRCSDAFCELEDWADGEYEYADVADWRGHLVMFLTLFSTNSIDIKFDLPEKVLDTSNITQSDEDDDDEADDDLADDSKAARAKDKRCQMRFEHCQIKPCTIKARLKADDLPEVLKASRQQDKKYVKSLMSAVPYDFSSEDLFERIAAACEDTIRPILHAAYKLIIDAGMMGITLHDLHNQLNKEYEYPLTSLLNLLQLLVTSYLVLRVGVTERVYVAHQNSRTWVVHSLRDTKGRGTGVGLNDDDKVTLSEDNPIEGSQSIPMPESMPTPATTYHRVDIIPKPWLTTEGTVNYDSLQQILTSVVSTINKFQSVKFESLHKLFSMVYSPVLLLDLLEILQDLGCVTCEYLTPVDKTSPSLFSKRPTYILSDTATQPHSIAHYTVNHEAMQRISLFIRNTSQKHGASAQHPKL